MSGRVSREESLSQLRSSLSTIHDFSRMKRVQSEGKGSKENVNCVKEEMSSDSYSRHLKTMNFDVTKVIEYLKKLKAEKTTKSML